MVPKGIEALKLPMTILRAISKLVCCSGSDNLKKPREIARKKYIATPIAAPVPFAITQKI
jgi:hypothetical protein